MSQIPTDTDAAELASQVAAAQAASPTWAETDERSRASVLVAIADALDAARDKLVAVADAETALGPVRLGGEVSRTSGQLRMFADYITRGEHLDVVISEPDAASARPDLRRMVVPVGPVAVFSASNFPFAFSVLGGDTASALAAGCPVIVKAHEGHPATSKLTTELAQDALRRAGAPDGLLATVYGQPAGRALLEAAAIKAAGFTGSLRGGRALMAITQARAEPIPFYGELGAVNPVVILPHAAESRTQDLATSYVGSLTLGVGQFCTNPGLMFIPDLPPLREAIANAVRASVGSTMLTEQICARYLESVNEPAWQRLEQIGHGSAAEAKWTAQPDVRHVTLAQFTADLDALTEERFGPAGLVVTYPSVAELLPVLRTLPGTLTASVHATDTELESARDVGAALRSRAGRLIFNGWPTGVAVCWAMHHGGPWPSSSAAGTTSVGATAIRRWLIPVAYQDWPDELLPPALQATNPLGVPRRVQPTRS